MRPAEQAGLFFMKEKKLIETQIFSMRDTNVVGFFIAITAVGLIWGIMALVVGDKGPPGFDTSGPFMLVVGVVFGALAWYKNDQSRKTLTIYSSKAEHGKNQFKIELVSKGGSIEKSFSSPFVYQCGWHQWSVGRKHRRRLLYVSFLAPDGKSYLTLMQYISVFDPIPQEWPALTDEQVNQFQEIFRSTDVKQIAGLFINR